MHHSKVLVANLILKTIAMSNLISLGDPPNSYVPISHRSKLEQIALNCDSLHTSSDAKLNDKITFNLCENFGITTTRNCGRQIMQIAAAIRMQAKKCRYPG